MLMAVIILKHYGSFLFVSHRTVCKISAYECNSRNDSSVWIKKLIFHLCQSRKSLGMQEIKMLFSGAN